MNTPDLPPPPPAEPDPAAVALANIRTLVRQGYISQSLDVAVAAALARGQAALEAYRAAAEPATGDEAVRRFLLALQAAGEELDRLAMSVAEGKGQAE